MIRRLALFLVIGALPGAPALAQDRYITDELRVPLRASPCDDCSVLHEGLVSGTKLKLEERSGTWARVRLESGLSGWLPSAQLVAQAPARERLATVQNNLQTLRDENETLKRRIKDFETASGDVAALMKQREDVEMELAATRKVAASASALREQNETLIKENRMLQSEVDVLIATRDQLMGDQTQKWFLYGAVAVFLGTLLAVLVPRLKPRRRFSEWG
ncbi:MAG: TIGR04211 family SH3 domain-containing protein [Pseudomonas sp.]